VLRELGVSAARKLVVSLAAGIRIESMEAATAARVMRVMTNTASAIGRAASALARGSRSTAADERRVREIFGAIGIVVEVNDEQIDAVTALAGSGPAFVYTVIEALAAGGEQTGLTSEVARVLAAQTALGAAELALTSGKSPEELRRAVVTPGGTTAAGLRELSIRKAADALSAAVAAAAQRGREMAREFGG
jgi:pyrroline-5-carboxylate reductase